MKIGVVIPSRLLTRPGGRHLAEFGPELWLDGALATVANQDWAFHHPKTFVGVDPETLVPHHVHNHAAVIWAKTPGQSAAVNVAAAAALGWGAEALLFLEDDDRWLREKALIQLRLLKDFDFVSSSQSLADEGGFVVGRSDYPIPSGWCMKGLVWERVGGFDEKVKWHVDTEWLGRLNQAKFRRAHLTPSDKRYLPNKLGQVVRFSEVVPCGGEFLVDRTVNSRGGMAKIFSDEVARSESDAEELETRKKFGCDPW